MADMLNTGYSSYCRAMGSNPSAATSVASSTSSSTSSASLSTSTAATKRLLRQYSNELEYAKTLVNSATTQSDKERFQLKVQAAEAKIASLTQPVTKTHSAVTQQSVVKTQEASESLSSKISNFESEYASAAPAASSTTIASSASTGGGHMVGNSYQGEAPSNATAATTKPAAPSTAPVNPNVRLAEVSKELAAASAEIATAKLDILQSSPPSGPGSSGASSTYREWREAKETKIQTLTDKCTALKAEETQLKSTLAATPSATPTTTTSTSNVVNKSMQSKEAQKEIKPLLSAISYHNALIKNATTQEAKDKALEKIGEFKNEILSIALKYVGVTPLSADSQPAVTARLDEISKELSVENTKLHAYKFNAWLPVSDKKIQGIKDNCAALEAEKAQLEISLATIPSASAATSTSLTSNASQIEYIETVLAVDDQNRAIWTISHPVGGATSSKSSVSQSTTLNKRLVEIAKDVAENYFDIANLPFPTVNIVNPTKAQSKEYVAMIKDYNAKYQAIVELNSALQVEEMQLKAKLSTINPGD